jgi:TolA-binding protein
MRRGLVVLLAVTCALCAALSAAAQTPETRTYEAAVRAFEDRALDLADKYFAEFLATYPNSPRSPEVILYRARVALLQRQTRAAADLLRTNAPRAGPLQDQYRYWLAETHGEATNYAAAAETFASLLKDFPASSKLLEASYGEALARFKLQEWQRVINLLSGTNSPFAREARGRPNDELVLRGKLLLADALLENGEPGGAEAAVRELNARELSPEFRWRAEYLLCRIRLTQKRAVEALNLTTNLLALAASTGQRQFVAESHAVRGAVLERTGDYPEAISAYERNVTEATPPEYRRQALLRIIELTLGQNKLGEATEKLNTFFSQYTQDAASEVALLTLGELNLRRHLASLPQSLTNTTPAPISFLQAALGQFDRLITNHPASPFLGKAYLSRGWALWFDGRMPEAQLAFQAATNKLRHSEEKAVAQFKIADIQFQHRDFTNALVNYRSVATHYKDVPSVADELVSQALYQMARASLEVGNLPAAEAAMKELVQTYRESPFADRGLLLLGQSFSEARRSAEARELFARFLKQYPESPLRPEVELAIARSYFREQKWEPALEQYEAWLRRFGTNELRARAEFSYACASYQAGRLTNALNLFTNFLARFPDDTNAPGAKYWVGTFYFEQKDYVSAEFHFQDLFQRTNWAGSRLSFDARLMAARAAAARQDYKSAYEYCLKLVDHTNPPPDLAVQAFFAAGDVLIQQASDPARPLEKYEEAIIAFKKIIQLYPASASATLAWGRIGDCNRQLASEDPKYYEEATNAYLKVVVSPDADVSARSQAKVGIAQILERLAGNVDTALWKGAFEYYYSVINPRDLREGEKIDPHWFKIAGLAAARLAEEHQEWETASRIYARMMDVLPPLRSSLEKKLEKAREQFTTGSL